MTVKELISKLEEMDGDAIVCIYDVAVYSNGLEQIDYSEIDGIEATEQVVYLDTTEVPMINKIVGVYK